MALVIDSGGRRTARPPVTNSSGSTIEQQVAAGIASNPNNYGYAPGYSYGSPTTTYINRPSANANIEYNVGMIKDAYFSSAPSFNQEMGRVRGILPSTIGSNPGNLWTTSGGHKGMLVVYVDPDGSYAIDGTPPNYDNATVKRYGFQFHYNPEAVEMVWAGVPNTDVNLETLSQEKFNLTGANATQSQISFSMYINRKHDFKYYLPNGTLHPKAPKDLYANRQPRDTKEQQEIYNKGTMYDLEYLASTVLGFKVRSALRGTTADIGYLTARRVELHLGKNLRYHVILNGFTASHTHFNENMTPVLSVLNLQCNRYPDYAK